MTVYVVRNGVLVEKGTLIPELMSSPLAAPYVSRFAAFESPVTGKQISSWRERERDMTAAGAVDPRDLPRKPFKKREKVNERQRKLTPERGGAAPT